MFLSDEAFSKIVLGGNYFRINRSLSCLHSQSRDKNFWKNSLKTGLTTSLSLLQCVVTRWEQNQFYFVIEISLSSYLTTDALNDARDASPFPSSFHSRDGRVQLWQVPLFPLPTFRQNLSRPDQIAPIKPTLNETHPPTSLGGIKVLPKSEISICKISFLSIPNWDFGLRKFPPEIRAELGAG